MHCYCYCCSNVLFSDCCKPIIENTNAANPEQLMRSRFSAYATKNYAYVLATYAPAQRQQLSIKTLSHSADNIRWRKLDVLASAATEKVGSVEFIANYTIGDEYFAMHELSSFIKQNNKWFYTTGIMQNKSGKLTPNRNDHCPCGSGKKHKKCCLA